MSQRVIIHGMHETDLHEAERIVSAIETATESYVITSIDDEQEKKLKDLGLFVEYLQDTGELNEYVSDSRKALRAQRLAVNFNLDPARTELYVVELSRPILSTDQNKFEQIGMKFKEAIGRNLYLTNINLAQRTALLRLENVLRVEEYFGEAINKGIISRSAAGAPKKQLTFDVRTLKENTSSILSWLETKHVEVAGSNARKIRIYLAEDSPIVDQIIDLDGVLSIEEYVHPSIRNDRARVILGIDQPGGARLQNFTQTGNGQKVGVADTGIDDTHKDLKNRLMTPKGFGRQNVYDDPDGHGTHVAGSIVGDGTSSNGAVKGIAPKATLYMQSLLDADGGLGGIPLDLNDLFQDAYDNGCRIHNNSWGSSTRSRYVGTSLEVDEFAHRNQDFLIVFAAGNEGQAANRIKSQKGFVDWLSVSSPGSAKNSLCVGASRSDRSDGGYSQLTWSAAWPNKFPDAPIGDEKISGNPDCLAGFSSRGPSDDRRILPHIVAPGTDILSTKSSTAPVSHFWGVHSNSDYAYDGGTSMASPIVTGCAALIREYLTTDRSMPNPSAALLKAIIVNSTVELTGDDAMADFAFIPNYHQGFGRLSMQNAIPADPEKLQFVDTYPNPQLQASGNRVRLNFYIKDNPDGELRICLCWPDPPGRALQNQLNLFLQEPSGRRRTGNERVPMSLGIPDPENNTQIIRIPQPTPGEYLVQVTATNLLKPNQNFALVVLGDMTAQGLF